jgi:hypothetical protein
MCKRSLKKARNPTSNALDFNQNNKTCYSSSFSLVGKGREKENNKVLFSASFGLLESSTMAFAYSKEATDT